MSEIYRLCDNDDHRSDPDAATEEVARPSKSERKRADAGALQELGERLVALPASRTGQDTHRG